MKNPLLDEIQGLGNAFAHQDKKGTRTELIIFIRPQIIRDGTDAHHVAAHPIGCQTSGAM